MTRIVTLCPGGQLVDAGIDWVTATTKDGDVWESLQAIGEELLVGQRERGFPFVRERWQGYSGYGGEGGFFGTGKAGGVLRVSGDIARRYATDIAGLDVRITRCDVQATVRTSDLVWDLARRKVDEFRDARGCIDGSTQPPAKCVDGGSAGVTAAFYERTGARYLRFYDKHRESKGDYAVGTFRLELEAKRQLADPLCRRLAEYGHCPEDCAGFIARECLRIGLHPGFRIGSQVDAPIVSRVTSDDDRRIAWLRKVVQPVVKGLHERGKAEQVAKALFDWLAPDEGLDKQDAEV